MKARLGVELQWPANCCNWTTNRVQALRAGPERRLRHLCISGLLATLLSLEAGERADVVAERLGHANVATTLSIYAHATAAAHRDAAARLGAVLDG
jgi:integrase